MKFDKKYEKLMEQYSLKEGIMSVVGNAIKNTLKKVILDPFKDKKFNPFAGESKPIDTSEAGIVISKIEEEWMDVTKKLNFLYKDEKGVQKTLTFSYSQLQEREDQTVSLFKKLTQSKK